MKKTILVLTIAALTFFGKAYAEMTYGISAAVTKIDASGTETEGGENNSATATNTALIPSVFAEFAYTDTIAIGLDFIPFKADVSNKTKSRQDTESSVTGTATHVGTSRTQRAQAELENHVTLYANYYFGNGGYLKTGVANVSLNTDESLGTGSKYGNEDIFGGVFGVGARSDNHRFELIYTDYEDISLTSSVARTGVTGNNTIDADLDTLAFKYSYAF